MSRKHRAALAANFRANHEAGFNRPSCADNSEGESSVVLNHEELNVEDQDWYGDNDLDIERKIRIADDLINNHPSNNDDTNNNIEISTVGSETTEDIIDHLNTLRSNIFTAAARHVKQKDDMRSYCDNLVKTSREHKANNVTWTDRVFTEVADYAQNLDIPHFGCEQPGDTYYYSPLGIYVFGIVRLYNEPQDLVGQFYFEGEGKKGGNNVASLIYNKFKHDGFLEEIEKMGQ